MNQLVPVGNSPNQTLVTSLNIDGVVNDYQLTLRYNEIAGYWVMTVKDAAGSLLLDSVPLVTGNSPAGNILGQFAYLGIGSAYVINAGGVPIPDYPNALDLGSDFVLIWGDTPTDSGSVLQEVSEGFAIASLQISHGFLHIPGMGDFIITVTLKGPAPSLAAGVTVAFAGCTGAGWLNGQTMTLQFVSGNTLRGEIITALPSATIYGPAPETGTVSPL